MVPGAACTDAPIARGGADGWFLRAIGGEFHCVYFSDGTLAPGLAADLDRLADGAVPVKPLIVVPRGVAMRAPPHCTVIEDAKGLLARRYDAATGTCYLIRPDQHVCARWRAFDGAGLRKALDRATACA